MVAHGFRPVRYADSASRKSEKKVEDDERRYQDDRWTRASKMVPTRDILSKAAIVVTLLGAAFGSPSHIRSHFSKFVSKTESILLSLKYIDDPQIAFQFQRYCVSTRLGSHLLRCSPPGFTTSVSTLDSITRGGFANIHGIPLALLLPQKFSWTQATLPTSTRRPWVDTCVSIADAAYVGYVTDTL